MKISRCDRNEWRLWGIKTSTLAVFSAKNAAVYVDVCEYLLFVVERMFFIPSSYFRERTVVQMFDESHLVPVIVRTASFVKALPKASGK